MQTTGQLQSGGLIVTPEQATAIKPFGLDMQVLLGSEDTGGTISVILACHGPGEGPPDHLHHTQEECFFILEGSYELSVGGLTRTVGSGSMVYLPRGVVHRFRNVDSSTARMLDWSLPGGQDRYFKEISALAGPGFSGEKVAEISRKHDTHFPAPH